ncbi:isoprenylcysteine carboxylmethyltransferase family protein [bacterium]|nr:isoprenylcysteine carboxylmethyltransferase family protein [bacterium]
MHSTRITKIFYLLVAWMCLCLQTACAADISFNLNVSSKDNVVTLRILNSGRDLAREVTAKIQLGTSELTVKVADELAAGQQQTVNQEINMPEQSGSYPIITTIYYLNEGKRLSLSNLGSFHVGIPSRLDDTIKLSPLRLTKRGTLDVFTQDLAAVQVVFPDEIVVSKREIKADRVRYTLDNVYQQFKATYPIYAYVTRVLPGGEHAFTYAEGEISTRLVVKDRSLFSASAIFAIFIVSLVLSFISYRHGLSTGFSKFKIAFIRYTFSVCCVSFFYLIFRQGYIFSDFALANLRPDLFSGSVGAYFFRVLKTLSSWFYFEGGDYDNFAKYIADPLYIYMLCINFFVIYYVIRPIPDEDKYWQLMKFCFSFVPLRVTGKPRDHWNRLTRLALLTFCVKLFYVPLLTSWTISNTLGFLGNYGQLIAAVTTGNAVRAFYQLNSFLVFLLIYVDVAIFTFGYLTELPQLKNQIKSVEPTVFGWFVCLACYPPFNSFSFKPFDIALTNNWEPPLGNSLHWFATILITLLWAIYTWASVALGVRSSNLTNRGIISRGPYRYVRHPAYISKVSLWVVETVFFGQRTLMLMTVTAFVYYLRALTEERHLGQDPDYHEYKRQVPYRFIPRLI